MKLATDSAAANARRAPKRPSKQRRSSGYACTTLAGCVASLLIACACLPAKAITLDATDSGFVTIAGGSSKGDGSIFPPATFNYSVGWELHYFDGSLGIPPGTTPLAPMERKNYFVFDLSGLTAPIASATLLLYTGVYESSDAFEDFVVGETTDPGGALADIGALAGGASFAEFDEPFDPLVGVAGALYTKLADGPLTLATAPVTAADDGTTIAIGFTPGGVGYLNLFTGLGPVVLGGKLTTLTAAGTPEAIFGGVGPDIPGGDPLTPMLEVTLVPEPSAWLLALLAACGMCAMRRRGGQTAR